MVKKPAGKGKVKCTEVKPAGAAKEAAKKPAGTP
jgi:hypothetical protein